MKKYLLLGIALLSAFLLAACCSNCYQSQSDLLRETWMQKIDTCPTKWTECADRWFLAGEPNQIEQCDHCAPPSKVISTMDIRVCDFSKIQVRGNFEVQLLGAQDHNSVSILGPNQQVRQIIVQIRHGTLYLSTAKGCKASLDKIIVRIGIRNLRNLTSYGPGLIEGRGVTGDCLTINSAGAANILLEGNMNLVRLNQAGTGTVTVMGANTQSLHLNVPGNGNVNISGRVGVQSIKHFGNGMINIIGADTDCLYIFASGSGFTGIAGNVNLKQVVAQGNSCVFVYRVNSCDTKVLVYQNATVGLAGITKNLIVNTSGYGTFQGSYLHAESVYVRTANWSHANVASNHKIFAAATNKSSIYYVGSPTDVSTFPGNDASILSFPNNPIPVPCLKPPSCMNPPSQVVDNWTYRPSYK